MKNIVNVACLLVFLLPMAFYSCDDGNDDTSPTAEAKRKLTRTWEVGTVMLEGFDVTIPSYENFAILFREDGSYFAVDANPVFTESGGFWTFINNDPGLLEIGGIEAAISFNEGPTELTLVFQAPGEQIGSDSRRTGLSGNYEFKLVASDQRLE